MRTISLLRLLIVLVALFRMSESYAQETHSFIDDLASGTSGRKWSLSEIKTTDDQVIRRASSVLLFFQKDLSGSREEKLDRNARTSEVKSRFKYQVDTVSNELIIRFSEVSIDRGKPRNLTTEPKLDSVNEFRVRIINRDNKQCLRLTLAGTGARPGVHYYFE